MLRSDGESGKRTMISGQVQDLAERICEIQYVILEYEKLSHQISRLLAENDGVTRNFSDEDYATYRKLAERRDLAHNRMRTLERLLLNE